MSNTSFITHDSEINWASLLAETVADGLHSLAQPLTATQFHLECAQMHEAGAERLQNQLSEARVALEDVVAKLNFLRDIIRPFRMGTEYRSESTRNSLLIAKDEQLEILQHEGVQVMFQEGCAEGTVVVPQGFMLRISFLLFSLVRSLAAKSVTFEISESERSVHMLASLAYITKPSDQGATSQIIPTIKSYVEVLTGDFSITQDFSSISMSLPK